MLFFNGFVFGETIYIYNSQSASNRVQFGVESLSKALNKAGYTVEEKVSRIKYSRNKSIFVFEKNDKELKSVLKKLKIQLPDSMKKEGFFISTKKNVTLICGTDGSGAIYGCREIIDRLENTKTLDLPSSFSDAPEMVLRGTAIGVQKPTYLPGRTVYEYPYTPETFPWFYDKEQWIKYLDMLVENRMNSVYLWNGHPFASLVRLKEYPFAVEVDDATFKKNEEIYTFLTREADKRGIFVIQMFYNIIVSKPFAEHYGIKTQDRNRPIIPYISDYTRKSIAAFVGKYPNVGLLVALGEAMATYEDDVKWFTETIIPGVKDGLKTLGRTDEPPIILRAHDTDAKMDIDAAKLLYKNLYTMNKYNGESLTTYEPRGPWTQTHQELSALGSVHISNVHILANLEPWRWSSPDFVRKSVLAMHNVHGANALHLYPQASFWDYPYTADKLPNGQREKQIDRDWMWYKTWARYAWNCHRDRNEEIAYWNTQLGDYYGINDTDARKIQLAYDESGEISPKLLRRFGITEGNRQTLLLGMFMSQLVNPYKYKIWPGFYESCGPEGEKLIEFVEKEWKHQAHVGELPLDIIAQVIVHADKAVEAIDAVDGKVTRNNEEFERLRNDMHCYSEFAYFFNNKVKAAKLVLDYQWEKDIKNLDAAVPFLEKSLEHYSRLVDLTKDHYLYANSMQTSQRRIPIGGDNGKNKTWEEMLVHYQKEFVNFKNNLVLLKSKQNTDIQKPIQIEAIVNAEVTILNKDISTVKLEPGVSLYSDIESDIQEIAPELIGLDAWVLNASSQYDNGTKVEFESTKPVNLLVGYFRDDQKTFAKAPALETDASANLYGQVEAKLRNAMKIDDLPAINVHVYSFKAGKSKLLLPRGYCLILGFTNSELIPRNAGLAGTDDEETMDWMFY
ncbi:MAG: hypothetical protein PHS59_10840 [Paludibacter sp.]|nr:hypothetical protein [Paludibacter sp.]